MSYIDKTSYPLLFAGAQFRILAASDITGSGITLSSGASGGSYGSSTTNTVTATITGGTLRTAALGNTAQGEVTSLVNDINALTIGTTAYTLGVATGFNPNTVYVTSNVITPSGTLTFTGTNSSTGPTDQFYIVASGGTIAFNGPVTYNLENGVKAENIFWISSGLISFDGATTIADGVFIAQSSITFQGSPTISGNLFAQTAAVAFNGTSTSILCYLKGSKILTENGYVLVEDLVEGDLVVSKGKINNNESYKIEENYSLKPVKWIGKFTVYDFNTESMPICIQANALGENLPLEDLFVSPRHRILLDGKLFFACDIVNGTTIYQDSSIHNIEYYHFELPEHSSVIANGILTESYLDFDLKNVFDK